MYAGLFITSLSALIVGDQPFQWVFEHQSTHVTGASDLSSQLSLSDQFTVAIEQVRSCLLLT